MSWVDETLKNLDSSDSLITKDEVKRCIAEGAHELLKRGWDWDDVEIFMVATLRPSVGELILLVAKWIREVRNEEREVTAQ
jgi:hypothetical protein